MEFTLLSVFWSPGGPWTHIRPHCEFSPFGLSGLKFYHTVSPSFQSVNLPNTCSKCIPVLFQCVV